MFRENNPSQQPLQQLLTTLILDTIYSFFFVTVVHKCEITSYKYCFQSLLSNYVSYYHSVVFLTSVLSPAKQEEMYFIMQVYLPDPLVLISWHSERLLRCIILFIVLKHHSVTQYE